jgi:serine/threonine protein kinase
MRARCILFIFLTIASLHFIVHSYCPPMVLLAFFSSFSFQPDNVLLTARREVKICDFGISRMVHDRSGMTTAVGTPLLMAPELVYSDTARESNTASRSATAVDVYSFGVLLWMMATQQLNPYQDMENPWALLAQVTRGRRPPLECRADAARKQHAKAQRAAAAAGAKGSATRPESADAAAGSYVPPSSPMSPAPSSSSSGSGSSNGNGGNSPRKTGTPRARRSRSAEGQWDPPDGEMLRGTNLLKLPQSFRDLIARCWHQDPSCRPTFSVVADELSELQELFLLGGCLDPRNSAE